MANSGDMEQAAYPAEKARQGEIILRMPLRRIIFLAGLVGCMLVAAPRLVFSH